MWGSNLQQWLSVGTDWASGFKSHISDCVSKEMIEEINGGYGFASAEVYSDKE